MSRIRIVVVLCLWKHAPQRTRGVADRCGSRERRTVRVTCHRQKRRWHHGRHENIRATRAVSEALYCCEHDNTRKGTDTPWLNAVQRSVDEDAPWSPPRSPPRSPCPRDIKISFGLTRAKTAENRSRANPSVKCPKTTSPLLASTMAIPMVTSSPASAAAASRWLLDASSVLSASVCAAAATATRSCAARIRVTQGEMHV